MEQNQINAKPFTPAIGRSAVRLRTALGEVPIAELMDEAKDLSSRLRSAGPEPERRLVSRLQHGGGLSHLVRCPS